MSDFKRCKFYPQGVYRLVKKAVHTNTYTKEHKYTHIDT